MFERYTDRARRMLNHNHIGAEHILLGLIHEGEGVAAKELESLGIAVEGARVSMPDTATATLRR